MDKDLNPEKTARKGRVEKVTCNSNNNLKGKGKERKKAKRENRFCIIPNLLQEFYYNKRFSGIENAMVKSSRETLRAFARTFATARIPFSSISHKKTPQLR